MTLTPAAERDANYIYQHAKFAAIIRVKVARQALKIVMDGR